MKFSRQWIWLLFIPLIVAGLSRLRLDADVLDLLPPNEPSVQGLKLYQQHFSNVRELIITVRCPTSEQAEAACRALAEGLQARTNLIANAAWRPPFMERPAEIGELLAWMRLNGLPQSLQETAQRLAPENLKPVLEETRQTLATSLSPLDIALRSFDPYGLIEIPTNGLAGLSIDNLQNTFSSQEGNFRVLTVQAATDITGYKPCISWLDSVKNIAAEIRAKQPHPETITLRYTGRPAFVAEIAGGMEHDISGSVTGTALVIACLFWIAHRRWLPLLWLLTLLALILVATLAFGGLILGTVSVLSMGFAAILLGLAVDYALVHYQEALAHPTYTIPQIRDAIAPSIVWAALTTISAFLVLNLGGLPGLAQLGSLVGIGVALSALVMVWAYLPPLFPKRLKPSANNPQNPPPPEPLAQPRQRTALGITALIVLAAVVVISFGFPKMDNSGNALRPLHSEAQAALDEVQSSLGMPQDPLWIIVSGQRETDVSERLRTADAFLNRALSNQAISGFVLPAALWPQPENQAANRDAARAIAQRAQMLHDTAVKEGFAPDALILTDEITRTFARAAASSNVYWPTNATSRWILNRFVARSTNEWHMMGLVYPATNAVASTHPAPQLLQSPDPNIRLSGWQLLGTATLERVQQNLWQVVLPMVLLVFGSLWMAFRRLREIALGIGVLVLGGLCLLAVMALAHWPWNLLNLMALPLMLGTGVDYAIFMQLALRRHKGNLDAVRRSVSRALLLCGATAVAGFGSLAWSSNAGMASLGKVCAIGIAANVLISVFLLPAWWTTLNHPKKRSGES